MGRIGGHVEEDDAVRALCCFAGGLGHAVPMVPVARALVAAGHEVAFAGDTAYLDRLRDLGFATLAVDDGAGVPDGRQPLVATDLAREEQVVRRHYVGLLPRRRAAAYRDLFERWRPDVVVVDEADFGAGVVAEQCGVPRATVLVIAAGAIARSAVVATALAELRAWLGLPADPTGARRYGDLVLSPFPPALRDPTSPLPAGTLGFGPAVLPDDDRPAGDVPTGDVPAGDMPAWWAARSDRSDRPLVYVTLGTIFPLESGDLLERLLTGLAPLPVDVLAAVGPDLDPAELGAYPSHVHVERWVPQTEVVARASLVVSHGGSGTLSDAVRAGVPQLVLALGADQLHNADRVTALGLGRALDPITCTPAEVGTAAAALLADPAYAERATALAREAATLPGPESVVPALVALATRGRSPLRPDDWSSG